MKLEQIAIRRIADHPEQIQEAACWFHTKWRVPVEAYMESMRASLSRDCAVPQWYVVMDLGRIIAGIGVIENDFHERKDLSPNVCAVYVEKEYRGRGIAGAMLDFVCKDMGEKGVGRLYLITDHTSFYERYGWEFLCMVREDGGEKLTRMYVHENARGPGAPRPGAQEVKTRSGVETDP